MFNQNLKNLSGISLLSLGILLFAVIVYLSNIYYFHLDRWDDAFITFRFAQHLAEGHGLVWNIGGEPVEGFTSFLHVLLLALGMAAGIDPLTGGMILSIVSVLATMLIILWIVRRQTGSINPLTAVIVGIYLIDAPTAIHTTSGLETQVFVATLAACYLFAFLFIESNGWRAAVLLGLFVFLSCVCRPEAVIYGFGLYLALAIYYSVLAKRKEKTRDKFLKLSVSSGIVLICGSIYIFWKLNYFGYILPNPFYVKSSQFSLAGLTEVSDYIKHLVKLFAPLMLAALLLFLTDRANTQRGFAKIKARIAILKKLLKSNRAKAKVLITLLPPIAALAFYSTIIHEVGGAYRFSYPTFFYFIIGSAVGFSIMMYSLRFGKVSQIILVGAGILSLTIIFISQKSWRITPIPQNGFNQYHSKIGHALKETGLGSKGTILCDAAGIIPYISGFSQLDRVGLADNYLSGRTPLTPEDREAYIWSRPLDVYVGHEPPAQTGAEKFEDDPQMKTQYVSEILMRRKLKLIEPRIFVQDPNLLHARMRELRDNWYLVGEMEWAGWKVLKLKSFVYVRRDSPHAQKLISELEKIVKLEPQQINLNDIHMKNRSLGSEKTGKDI